MCERWRSESAQGAIHIQKVMSMKKLLVNETSTYGTEGWRGRRICLGRATIRHRREVAIVGEVGAGSVGVDAGRTLWGRRLVSFTSALRADTSKERGRRLLGIGLAGSAGRTSVSRCRSTVSSSIGRSARRVCNSPASGRSARSSATGGLVTVTAIVIGGRIGVNETAAFAIGTRAG